MADIFTPEKRSWVMSQIRGKNTKIELKMKRMLADTGYKFEMHPEMYGNPRLCTQEKEDSNFLRRGLLARLQIRRKEKACKKILATTRLKTT